MTTPTTGSDLDQSKAPKTNMPFDFELRVMALNYACQAHNGPNGYPEDFMAEARRVHQFLVGNDPVIDCQISASDNVISIAEWVSKLDD